MGFSTTLPQPEAITSSSAGAVREQLERVVAHPLFASSRRYPGMLRYVVEQALENPGGELKERTIGIEVFGREPSYDTNHDPVVRTSAVEIRKRLIQYYQDPAHANEVRIELVVGSYVPRFHGLLRELDKAEPDKAGTGNAEREIEAIALVPDPRPQPWFSKRVFVFAALVVLFAAAIVRFVGSAPAVDRFWSPIMDSPDPVLIGLSGGPGAVGAVATDPNTQTFSDLFRNRSDYVPMGDVAAMARILANLKERGKPFNLIYSSTVQLADLKSGPAILIGPVNRWLEMMSKDLRFTIQRDDAVTRTWISDRQNPERRDWSVQVNAPASSVAEAYALISRVWNPTTGKFMICISGLSPYATSAAGEFVSNPQKMAELLKSAPSGWSRGNVQIVIAATRVGTNVGIPRAVATYFW